MAIIRLQHGYHVVRYVSKQRWRKIEGRNVVFRQAFQLRLKSELKPPHNRHDEKSLSCVWCEYFAGTEKEQAKACVKTLADSGLVIRKESAAVVRCSVGKLENIGKNHSINIRVLHKPTHSNPAKASIDGMQAGSQTDKLLAEIAETAISHCFPASSL